ncbi:MAG: TlpA disulfide reductase family protein [Planctomycetota bacterium]
MIKPPVRLSHLLLTVGLLLGLAPWATASSRYAIGDAVDFEMKTIDNERFTSEDLRGRLVVVEFWATWCGPCVEMIPHLKKMNNTYEDQGVVMISVSVDDDTGAARKMIRQRKMDWVMVLNKDQESRPNGEFFSGRYGIPHAFLISPDGDLLWNGHPARLETAIEDAMETHPPGRRDGGDGFTSASAEDVAKKAAEASLGQKPDFHELYKQLDLLPEDAFDQAKVKAFGRSIKRSLDKLSADQQEDHDLYITAYPEKYEKLQRWLDASARSISESSGRDTPVNPEVVASRFQQAELAEDRGDDLEAYELYRWIVDRAPDSDEAMFAQDVILMREADEAFMAKVEAQKLEAKAKNLMDMARNFAAAGLDDKVEELYRQVIEDYPDTEAAKQAAAALGK